MSVNDTYASLNRLKDNKGMGGDAIPAELLKAGGMQMANIVNDVEQRIVEDKIWPFQWTGGKNVSLYKGKLDPKDRDNYRGFLLADHQGKSFVSRVREQMGTHYTANMPTQQFGAVAKKGTDMAGLMVQLAIQYASFMNWSICILYIDLVKAFDRIVRELILGYPSSVGNDDEEKKKHLASLGLPGDVADFIFTHLDKEGPLLERWGVDEVTIDLLRALHLNAWFSIGTLEEVVIARVGGRQGCLVGAIIFNSVYKLALEALRKSLADDGLTLLLALPEGPFWSGCFSATEKTHFSDCAFVDDECIVFIKPNANRLDEALPKVLGHVVRIFSALGLEINFNPGKTEAMVTFRGHGMNKVIEKRIVDGKLYYTIPGKDISLVITRSYKHLGSVVTASGCTVTDAAHKEKNAMQAFAPLAKIRFSRR